LESGVVTDEPIINVPEEWLQNRIRRAVVEKACKRLDWDDVHKSYAYIIGLVSSETWLDDAHVEGALLGSNLPRDGFVPPHPEVVERVKQAERRGWGQRLSEAGLIRDGQVAMDARNIGAFFTDPVCSNVSGVISLFVNWEYSALTNPLASSEIFVGDISEYLPR
jgi:hypothetical protein